MSARAGVRARGASEQESGLGDLLSFRTPACREGNAREGLASCLVLMLYVCARRGGPPEPLVSRVP